MPENRGCGGFGLKIEDVEDSASVVMTVAG